MTSRRLVIAALAFLAVLLLLTADLAFRSPDDGLRIAWLTGSLLPLAAAAWQCVVTLVRALRRRHAGATFDITFWIVFLVLPSVLVMAWWAGRYLLYLLAN